MTLYGYPDPEAAALTYLGTKAALLPTGTTMSTLFPASDIAKPHIQIAWDGTPTEDENREIAVVRVTVWTPKGQRTLGKTLATLARALMLDFSSAGIWRVTKGVGRLPGIDPDTGLPFVTFTVNAETRPSAVA